MAFNQTKTCSINRQRGSIIVRIIWSVHKQKYMNGVISRYYENKILTIVYLISNHPQPEIGAEASVKPGRPGLR